MLNIKIEKFEGPLELLLKMIEKEKLDIAEISLAKIADEYVEFIKNSPQINPELVADFLVIAAKLLYIKSKTLLPYLFPEEDEDMGDLENQLRMYKEFLKASEKVEEIIKKEDLKNIFEFFIERRRPKKLLLREDVIEYKINIEDKIRCIEDSLISKIKTNFSALLKEAESKTEIIVSFLAVLELIKQKTIGVRQDTLFSDFTIHKGEIKE